MNNCNRGDIATLTYSVAGNEGKIFRCLQSFYGDGSIGYGLRWITYPVLFDQYGCVAHPLDKHLLRLDLENLPDLIR